MTAADKIAEHLRQSPQPASVSDITAATSINICTVKMALCKMKEQGRVLHVGRHNATRYVLAPPKPPMTTAATVCNGSMRAPLVYSSMHSDRPGAMDYQSIPSLVGSQRVPYRAGVVR